MYVFPAGGQRGTTVERMARGRGLEGASEVRISGQGVTGKVIAVQKPSTRLQQRSANRQDQSENPNVVKFSVTIAPDAEPGARDLWIITPKGATNRFKFVVGQLPEVNEVDEKKDNNELSRAQSIESLPVLINGQIDQGDRDIFRFPAKAGQTLVCEVQGQSILPYIADAVPGWLQACLTLYDSTGKELVYVDDWRFRPDPVILFKVEKDGEYLLEIKDVLYRGREDLVYRLSVGAVPFITHIFPLGGQRDTDAQVQLYGANLPAASASFAIPGDAPPLRHVQVAAGGLTTNALPFAVDDIPETQEAEPNDAVDQANKISAPVTINGRIQQNGDADYFAFSAKANDVLALDVQARRLESPLDSIITLFTSKGRQLAENDDTIDESQGLITHHADSYLRYTIRADGDYVMRIGDVQDLGGEQYAYRLSVAPPRPDFDLRAFPANLSVPQGGSGLAKVKAYRRDGFNGEIRVSVAGLPQQFVASDLVVPAGQKEVRFTITAPPNAPPGVVSPTFEGKAKIGEDEVIRPVTPAEDLMQAFYYRHDVPTDEFLLATIRPLSITLSANSPPTQVHEVVQGGKVSVVVKASREGLKAALARAEAGKKAAEEALAKVKADVAKAKADYDAAEKAAREAVTAAASARTAAARAATAQANTASALLAKRQQANAAKKTLDDLVQNQKKPAEAKLAAAAKAVTDAAEDQRAQAESQKKAAEQALATVNSQVAAATTAYEAAEKAAKEAETAAANAKAEADKARTAQAAAEKAAPEKRRLANAARVKRDRMPAVERAATAKATQATKRVTAIKQAQEKGAINLKADTPPRGITVKAANIPAGQNEATITVTVTKQAPVGFRQNIILTGSLRAGQETFTGVVPAIPIKVVAPPK